jgi:hypothetical protein
MGRRCVESGIISFFLVQAIYEFSITYRQHNEVSRQLIQNGEQKAKISMVTFCYNENGSEFGTENARGTKVISTGRTGLILNGIQTSASSYLQCVRIILHNLCLFYNT